MHTLLYYIKIKLNMALQALVYLNTSDLQHSLYTVLLTVPLTALKERLITELAAVPDFTIKNHTELK
jgi:hypothetical protein